MSFVLLGRQALAEVPALALLLCGLYVYVRVAPSPPSSYRRMAGLLAAGVFLGLAMLSRQQWALTFGPAVLLLAALRIEWRVRGWPRRALTELLPIVLMVATVAAWKTTEYLNSPDDLRATNTAMALDAMRTNLLTDLWGRGLTRTGWAMVVAMSGSVVMAAGWLVVRRRSLSADQLRFHLFMIAGVLAHDVWFAFFSVGWPRYAFPGLVFALVVASVVAADVYVNASPLALQVLSGHQGRAAPAESIKDAIVLIAGAGDHHLCRHVTGIVVRHRKTASAGGRPGIRPT